MPRSLEVLPNRYAACRLAAGSGLPWWAAESEPLLSFTRTPDETSVVCEESRVPGEVRAQRGYRALRVDGPIPFDEVGVVAGLSRPLAKAGIPVFALSTFDTDYLLVGDGDLERALVALTSAGFSVRD